MLIFEVKDKTAYIHKDSEDGLYHVAIVSKKTKKQLSCHILKSIDGIQSFTALMRVCKDSSNQFCPLPVSCDSSQDGGNLSPPPVSLINPTTGGNLLLQFQFKNNNSVSFMKNVGFVLAVINVGDDKYRYPMSFENYYRIKKIDDDCFTKHGYRIGLKRLIWLCKKYAYDRQNADWLAA